MSSKTDSVVKLVIVFFVSLLSFSVGTFVGKKYSDNQHQLSILEPQRSPHAAKQEGEHGAGHSSEREVASTNSHSEAGGQKAGAMTDEEIAKLAEEFVADETTAPIAGHGGQGEHNEAPAAADTHGTKGHGDNAKAEVPESHNEKAQTQNKLPIQPERVPTALPKEVAQYTVGKFTVQVASYDNELEAQKVASDLKGKGYSAFYVPAKIQGKTWYRVSVGQFTTQKEAASYRTEFMNTSKMTTAIVQKIIQ